MARLRSALVALEAEADIVQALRLAERLAEEPAVLDGNATALDALKFTLQFSDELGAIAALHALSRMPGSAPERVLCDSVTDERPAVAEHAAWALSGRSPVHGAIGDLTRLTGQGGFTSMIAQRTLIGWAKGSATAGGVSPVAAAVEKAIDGAQDPSVRARLVETLGEVPGELITVRLRGIAVDGDEDLDVRARAVAALGDRPEQGVFQLLTDLSAVDDELGTAALLALDDLTSLDPGPRIPWQPGRKLRIGQLYLHAELDQQLAGAGGGDTGGIATLMVILGRSLAAHEGVDHVVTIGRGSLDDALVSLLEFGVGGQTFAAVPLGAIAGPPPSMEEAWPYRVQVERHLRRVLRRTPSLDVLHLRMAEVGTLAAASAARRIGLPVAFSVAPDPHALIGVAQQAGRLRRAAFGRADQEQHLWFRMRMVERLIVGAELLALFPRPRLATDLLELIGIDVAGERERSAVVPEGIDLRSVLDAERRVFEGEADLTADLRRAVGDQPADRHGLPVLLTVARLHPVKGLDRVVQAWATDAELRKRCNLVIVGGDLARPGTVEQAVLDQIGTVMHRAGQPDGLVMLGRRSHRDTLTLMALVWHGAPPEVGPGGVYVNGAAKEEFGLAMVEALATGLPVVGPDAGAPAVYVEHGCTGLLVGPTAPIGPAIVAAFDLVDVPGRAEQARRLVHAEYTVDAVADGLVDLYRGAPTATGP